LIWGLARAGLNPLSLWERVGVRVRSNNRNFNKVNRMEVEIETQENQQSSPA